MPSFNSIPSNLRVPFVAVEFDASQAQQGPALLAYRGLIIGQKLTAGTATANTAVRCTSVDQAIVLAGQGSMLHRQAIGWFASNRSTELWLGVLDDDEYGATADGSIVVAGPADEDGTIALYLGGVRVTVGVTAEDTADEIATAIAAAITARPDLPIEATAATSTVTLEAKNAGEVGNKYDVRHSFRDGEALPEGVELTITPMAGGTGNPALEGLFAAIENLWFHIWTHPYIDATSLEAIEDELADRFGPMRSIDGLAITSTTGNFAAHTSLGDARNSQHSVIVAQPGQSTLTPPMEFAAEVAALVALHGAADPARPFQTLAMSNALAPVATDQWSLNERNLFLFDGIATTKRGPGGVVQLERIITTYQESPAEAADTAYLDATTMLTLMYLRYSFRVRMQLRYPRHKLANDGTKFGSGQAVITPKLGKAEAITWFREMEELGLVEGFDQFKRDLDCVRSELDPNRLEFLLPPDLINQLMVTAASIQFRL